MSAKRQKIRYPSASDSGGRGEASNPVVGGIEASTAKSRPESPAKSNEQLMETICERDNCLQALKRVKSNKGSGGIDGMTVEQLPAYLKEHWPAIRDQLLSGTYQPSPVRRVEIPKPDGGVRKLGIPAVLDRMIQQAVLQVLQGEWDATFSPHSHGFRPGHSAHQAVAEAQQYVREGRAWVVDLDLEKFFDRVNHDRLMAAVARRVADKRLLRLIRAYLKAGVMENGLVGTTEEGTPQGGPLTPLTQKVIWAGGLVYGLGTALRGALRDRNAMANGDGVVSNQDVFHNEPDDSLTLNDAQRISSPVQAVEKRGDGLREAKEGRPIVGLVSDCLQFDAERLFALAQRRHTLAQLLDRHERLLVGAEKPFDALANMR